MISSWRQWLARLVRLLVVVAAVGWLATQMDWSEVRGVIASADWRLILVAVAAFGPAPVLLALRLRWLLAVHQVALSSWLAIRITFASNFIIWALPFGTSGGDAAKAVYIAGNTPQKHEAVTTVFFDRIIGVASLVLLSAVMILLNWGNPAFDRWGRTIAVLVAVMFAGAVVYFSRRLRGVLHLDQIVARLPLAAHMQRIDRAMFAFRHRKGRLAVALVMTLALQVVGIVSLFLAGWAMGLVGGNPLAAFPIYLAYLPICFLAGALPIGVMEITYIELFSVSAGLGTSEAAVSLSLLSRVIQLVWALPGALVILGGTRPVLKQELHEEVNDTGFRGSTQDSERSRIQPQN